MKFEHRVMNCHDFDATKFHNNGCVGIKYDGVRGFYYPGESHLWSRDFKPLYGFDHIIQDLKDSKVSYPVDMELYIEGMEFNKLSGRIRDYNNTPEAVGKIIDIVAPGNLPTRFKHRPNDTPHIQQIPHYRITDIRKLHYWYKVWLSQGLEGVVWKDIEVPYTNTKSWGWLRKVPIQSIDAKCIGVYEGKGKMAGIAGGIFVEYNGLQFKVGTMKGLTYEDRYDIFINQDAYIGLTCIVEFKNLQPSGKPRQPRFKGWRYDK